MKGKILPLAFGLASLLPSCRSTDLSLEENALPIPSPAEFKRPFWEIVACSYGVKDKKGETDFVSQGNRFSTTERIEFYSRMPEVEYGEIRTDFYFRERRGLTWQYLNSVDVEVNPEDSFQWLPIGSIREPGKKYKRPEGHILVIPRYNGEPVGFKTITQESDRVR